MLSSDMLTQERILANLQGLEHMGERFNADQEVADDHRRAEMSAVVEGLLSNTH